MPDKPISPLRQRLKRLIDDMTARRYGEKAQKAYVRHVRSFAALLGRSSDMTTSDDLRRFQTTYGAAADQRRVDQRGHRRAALLFHP